MLAYGKLSSSRSIRSYKGNLGLYQDCRLVVNGELVRTSKQQVRYKNSVRFHQMPFDRYRDHLKSVIQFTGEPEPQFQVPYWSIVAPLTLLSAWLLVSKPRKPAAG